MIASAYKGMPLAREGLANPNKNKIKGVFNMIRTTIDYWPTNEFTNLFSTTKPRVFQFLAVKQAKADLQRAMDLSNACPRCHIIRSLAEIANGTCENCA